MTRNPANAWPVSEVAGVAGFVGGIVLAWIGSNSAIVALLAGALFGAVGSALRRPLLAVPYIVVLGVAVAAAVFVVQQKPPALPAADTRGPAGFTAERFRFFESGSEHPPLPEREFAHSFDSTRARFVCWQLDASFRAPTKRVPVRIHYAYFKPDGSLLGQAEHATHLEAGWAESWHSRCWGWQRPGAWVAGTYRVTLTLDGNDLIKGSFAIY